MEGRWQLLWLEGESVEVRGEEKVTCFLCTGNGEIAKDSATFITFKAGAAIVSVASQDLGRGGGGGEGLGGGDGMGAGDGCEGGGGLVEDRRWGGDGCVGEGKLVEGEECWIGVVTNSRGEWGSDFGGGGGQGWRWSWWEGEAVACDRRRS